MIKFSVRHRRRFALITALAVILMTCMGFILYTLRQSIVFYYTPSELLARVDLLERKRTLRIGGLVLLGSLHTTRDGVQHFILTDGKKNLTVDYRGAFPSLFSPGRGAVVEGRMHPLTQTFRATYVLAKHDENYRIPSTRR